MSDLRNAALAYAAKGWAVFPCAGKKPLTGNGFVEDVINGMMHEGSSNRVLLLDKIRALAAQPEVNDE